MDFDRIEPDDPDVDIDDEQQPLISESIEKHIPFVRRKTTTSQEHSDKFITGETSSNVIREPRILLANEKLQKLFPDYGKKSFLDLEVAKKKDGTSKVQIIGPYGGK